MKHTEATARTVSRVLLEALAAAQRDRLRFEPGARVWVKVPAPERLRLRGDTETVWREGVVQFWMEDRGAYQVTLSTDPGLAFLAGLGRVRRAPPWLPETVTSDN